MIRLIGGALVTAGLVLIYFGIVRSFADDESCDCSATKAE